MHKRGLSWAVCTFIVLFDQLSKISAIRSLNPFETTAVIKNIFHLSLVYNTGAAFGLFKEQGFFFILISAGVIIYISINLAFNSGKYSLYKHAAYGLILGGALGNLSDRLRLGYIVDFLDFRIWPVFNIADSAITVGIVLLALEILWPRMYKKNVSDNI